MEGDRAINQEGGGKRLTVTTTVTPVKFEVVSPDFLLAHPELHHYTTGAGFQGIVSSNTLWATHFEDLNDSTEVVLLRGPLLSAMQARFVRMIAARSRESLRTRRLIEGCGGTFRAARGFAEDLVASLYKVTFKDEVGTPMGVPYISSFCTHTEDQEYEKQNGLLSQWRGYGRDGGFCIVFDTQRLADMVSREFERRYFLHASLGAATYALASTSVADGFSDLLRSCDEMIAPLLEGSDAAEPPAELFTQLMVGATLFKHQGFREEREVRVVVVPGTEDFARRTRERHPEWQTPPIVELKQRATDTGRARYLTLLESLGEELPIKRIIVGPSVKQKGQLELAKSLVGRAIPIHASETPFIG